MLQGLEHHGFRVSSRNLEPFYLPYLSVVLISALQNVWPPLATRVRSAHILLRNMIFKGTILLSGCAFVLYFHPQSHHRVPRTKRKRTEHPHRRPHSGHLPQHRLHRYLFEPGQSCALNIRCNVPLLVASKISAISTKVVGCSSRSWSYKKLGGHHFEGLDK